MSSNHTWARFSGKILLSLIVIGFNLWAAMAWSLNQNWGWLGQYVVWGGLLGVAVYSLMGIWKKQTPTGKASLLQAATVLTALTAFFSLEPKQDRHWQADVERILDYQLEGEKLTLHNVRNFHWRSETDFDARWETRQYDLNQITGVNIITSYWMGPQIAHTLVSFDFANQSPLVFSIEIRKEQGESFSAIGGFFRQYELSLIAADEKDIVYTRSNVRGEQVYFFPIQGLSKTQMQALFLQYLQQAQSLKHKPQWYNTLFSNCTTLVYDMAKHVSDHTLPLDYRLLASGYLPNYLHDLNAIDSKWDMQTWYKKAHVNPKTPPNQQWDSDSYSAAVRAGLPTSLPK